MWTIQGTPPPERSLRPSTPSCRHDMTKTSASNGSFVVRPQISLFSSSHLLQDNDFKLLRPGDPIFKTFSGETVTYEGEELYTFFINECAYYEKKIAFLLGEKVKLNLPPISVKKDWDRKRISIKKGEIINENQRSRCSVRGKSANVRNQRIAQGTAPQQRYLTIEKQKNNHPSTINTHTASLLHLFLQWM